MIIFMNLNIVSPLVKSSLGTSEDTSNLYYICNILSSDSGLGYLLRDYSVNDIIG